MAHDLLLGRTKRSWSAGFSDLEHRTLAEDVLASRDVGKLAAKVESGIQQNFKKILELTAAKKMPEGERKSYAKVVRRFRDLEDRRDKKFQGSDYVELRDLRDANRRTATRLEELSRSISADGYSPLLPGPATSTEANVLRLSRINLTVGIAGLLAAVYMANRISPRKNVS